MMDVCEKLRDRQILIDESIQGVFERSLKLSKKYFLKKVRTVLQSNNKLF